MKDVMERMTGKKENGLEQRLLALLSQNGPLKAKDIAMQLGAGLPRVRSAIKTQRKHFLDGKTRVRITTGPRGYSLIQNRKNVSHETNLRVAQIAGNMLYGAPVFLKCRKIAAKDFASIQLKYQPKMISFNKLLT